jgi:hypothetical protein
MSNKMGRQAKFQNLKFLQSDKRREPYVSPSGVKDEKKYASFMDFDIEELEKELGRKAKEYYEKEGFVFHSCSHCNINFMIKQKKEGD